MHTDSSENRLALRGCLAALPPDAVLSNPEAAIYCGAGGSTWERMRAQGKIPPAIRLTGRTLGFRKRDLDIWLDSRTERSVHVARPGLDDNAIAAVS